MRTEGVFARWGGLWFPGLAASMMREASYSSFRFGLYTPVKRLCGADKGDVGLLAKVSAALLTLCDARRLHKTCCYQVSAGAISGATGELHVFTRTVPCLRSFRESFLYHTPTFNLLSPLLVPRTALF